MTVKEQIELNIASVMKENSVILASDNFILNNNCGKVSFNFPQEEKLKLSNKSSVPFVYNLRIPGDGKLKDREFVIPKSHGEI